MDHAWGYGSEQRLREENQDSFGVFDFDDYALAVVCDGMGGHVGGAQASSLAVRTIHSTLRELAGQPLGQALDEALTRANLVIYEAARKNHRLMGMGTTVVVAAVQDGLAYVAHVGDSRAYLVRDGQATSLTRDHTMVNLFVDAELLTPEDAETHPEAHVLSRSLGVERQVEVEVSEPFELQPGDAIFLCSDGVHGVVTDWELANVDWGAPHAGVRHVLDIVSARDGDDNATAVAVMMGTSFEDVPPTPVPEPKRIEDPVSVSSFTAVPPEDGYGDYAFEKGDATEPAGPSSYIVYEEPEPEPAAPTTISAEGSAAPAPAPAEPISETSTSKAASSEAKAPEPTQKKIQATKKKGRSRLVPVLIGAGVVAMGLVGVVLLFVGSSGPAAPDEGGEPLAQVDPVEAPPVPAPVPAEPAPAAEPGEGEGEVEALEGTDTDTDTEAPEVPEVVEAGPLFAPELPAAPRRLPHRPTRFTQPPPGGPVQYQSVQAARNKRCAQSLAEVQQGMSMSVDYAALYRGAWLCFVDVHQRPLEQASVEGPQDFIFVLPHFEGPPEERQAQARDPELAKVPEWFRPAVDGIEYRLEAYLVSDQSDKLVDVLNDQFGEPTVTDQLARDLHLVALAAEGLSRAETDDGFLQEKVRMWWARRVYVATRAMNGRVGRAIERHRPELVPEIRELLERATSPRSDADGNEIPVPEMVIQARDVGLGAAPPPSVIKAKKAAYVPPKELDFSDLDDDAGSATVQRAGEPNFGTD